MARAILLALAGIALVGWSVLGGAGTYLSSKVV